jgi:hypothetical protein
MLPPAPFDTCQAPTAGSTSVMQVLPVYCSVHGWAVSYLTKKLRVSRAWIWRMVLNLHRGKGWRKGRRRGKGRERKGERGRNMGARREKDIKKKTETRLVSIRITQTSAKSPSSSCSRYFLPATAPGHPTPSPYAHSPACRRFKKTSGLQCTSGWEGKPARNKH